MRALPPHEECDPSILQTQKEMTLEEMDVLNLMGAMHNVSVKLSHRAHNVYSVHVSESDK